MTMLSTSRRPPPVAPPARLRPTPSPPSPSPTRGISLKSRPSSARSRPLPRLAPRVAARRSPRARAQPPPPPLTLPLIHPNFPRRFCLSRSRRRSFGRTSSTDTLARSLTPVSPTGNTPLPLLRSSGSGTGHSFVRSFVNGQKPTRFASRATSSFPFSSLLILSTSFFDLLSLTFYS